MPKRKNSRNASGSGSVRQRKDGKWEGRYSNGVSPGTGKPIRKSVYGATQREVVDKLTAIKAGIDAGTFIEPSKLTVSMWLNIWVAEYLGEVKQRTAQEYKGTCRLYLKHEV
ncbi:MAG: site-specific integrase, partial [Firmicutes bacterium]|nr:site-specific integrase [Bacillota bacterium]